MGTSAASEPLYFFIVYSAPSCASQPISLHRNLNFCQLNRIFCQYVYYLLSKSLSKSVKGSMRPFSKEPGENYKQVVCHKSYITIIKKSSGSLAALVPT